MKKKERMVRNLGTENLSQLKDVEKDEKEDGDYSVEAGTVDVPQIFGGTACR